jgi:DNA polymerase II large subunit
LVVLIAAVVHAEVLELDGTVKAVDATARTIRVERKNPKGTKTLELQVTKKAGDLSGVKAGDSISFSYDPDLEVVTRIVEETKQSEKVGAEGDDAFARPYLDKILMAIEENDYDGFVTDFTGSFKAQTTKKTVAGINEQLASRMKKGYDVVFLTDFKQRGQKAYLWKLIFKDGGDDWSAKVWLKDGKVSGFLLQ